MTRVNLSEWENYEDFETRQPSSAPKDSETHSGADVGIFASGTNRTNQNKAKYIFKATSFLVYVKVSFPKTVRQSHCSKLIIFSRFVMLEPLSHF